MKIDYNKLVRDKIPEIIKDSGRTCDFKVLDNDDEMKNGLKEKLIEKAQVFTNKPSEDELSDIYELLDTIVEIYDFESLHIDYLKLRNKENKGSYLNRVYLISVDDGQ